ncbi:uncharacterized protein KIAA0408-like [Syngnathus typhle]|uniref:uncharacterized protein KIAA0408-like n=1 Tax=Syngnathus typhle TaxID=161592 RepID=UPI002A6AE946|nr:uncharacterized protein KIAA0408-like [Syngnathus typhle]
MAATDLERGLEHGGRGWGKARPEMMDNFDSEMQEWEDQLQDIQRQIEELYNEVQARREGNGAAPDYHNNIDVGPRNHGDGIFTHAHQRDRHLGNDHPAGHRNGDIGDFLQDYLGHSKHVNQKNNGARHVHFSDTIKVSQDLPVYQDESRRRTASQRVGHEQFLGTFEELENRKNRAPHAKSCPNKENSVTKPPLRQKEASPPRSTAQPMTAESPTSERKSYGPGVLGDKKLGSLSILRKFGAMLHENEGKTLTDAGVVTSEVKCLSPGCQRRGAATGPVKIPPQNCNSEVEHWGSEPTRHHHKDLQGGSQTRAQVPGSPRNRPRSNSAADRDRSRSHQGEPNMDYRIHRGRLGGQSEFPGSRRDEGLIELLDMLKIQHEYTSRAYKTNPQQVNPPQRSSEPKTSFSRPARPANQRPPSRWASRTPSTVIAAPMGPNYRPPSPLVRPPSPLVRPPTPKIRTPSPALKLRPAVCYSRPAETVIM